jgi:hypothetical protein
MKRFSMSHEKSSSSTGGEGHLPAELSDVQCNQVGQSGLSSLLYSYAAGFTDTNGVITTTMFDVPGYRVTKVFGTVYGITVRSRNWAAGLGMVLKSIAGGELKWFTNMVSWLIRNLDFVCVRSTSSTGERDSAAGDELHQVQDHWY